MTGLAGIRTTTRAGTTGDTRASASAPSAAGTVTAPPVPLDSTAALPRPVEDDRLDTPAMLIDLDVAEANIAKMAAFAERAGLCLRPHIKTHKSVAMARRQLAAGAAGLCVATVTEAAAMAAAGLRDLTLAYPVVGQRKLERLAEVCRIADVRWWPTPRRSPMATAAWPGRSAGSSAS